VYLYHIPIIRWLHPEQLGWKAPAETLTVVVLSLAAAVASYFVVERPCLRWKSRLQPLVKEDCAGEHDARDVAAGPPREVRRAA
jgi:peptidoglycan/LPS O-acetylase OafA/YrhL